MKVPKPFRTIYNHLSGREISNHYDNQMEYYSERNVNSMYDDLISNIKKAKRVALIGISHLPNSGEVLSLGALIGYLATQNPKLLVGSLTGLVCSEIFRYVARKSETDNIELNNNWVSVDRQMDDLEDTLSEAKDKVKEVAATLFMKGHPDINLN